MVASGLFVDNITVLQNNDTTSTTALAQDEIIIAKSAPTQQNTASKDSDQYSERRPAGFGCRSIDAYERLNKISEGTYGVVYKAKDRTTNELVAIKQFKITEKKEGIPHSLLREINSLISLRHNNIVNVHEVVMGGNGESVLDRNIFMVMEHADNDLKNLISNKKQRLSQNDIKSLMHQLLSGLAYLHKNYIMHRDLKSSNILLTKEGVLKICDFGLARKFTDSKRTYTPNVVTQFYRAPEILLGSTEYTPAVDMWSVGCIFAELAAQGEHLFPATSDSDIAQLKKIVEIMGTPSEKVWPGYSKLPNTKKFKFDQRSSTLEQKFRSVVNPLMSKTGLDLLQKMLQYDPSKRISASQALAHPYFTILPKTTTVQIADIVNHTFNSLERGHSSASSTTTTTSTIIPHHHQPTTTTTLGKRKRDSDISSNSTSADSQQAKKRREQELAELTELFGKKDLSHLFAPSSASKEIVSSKV